MMEMEAEYPEYGTACLMGSVAKTVIVYHGGRMVTGANGVVFECDDPKIIKIDEEITFDLLKAKIAEQIEDGSRTVLRIYYCCPIRSGYYQKMSLQNDNDIYCMMDIFEEYARLGPIELYVELLRTTAEVLALCREPETVADVHL